LLYGSRQQKQVGGDLVVIFLLLIEDKKKKQFFYALKLTAIIYLVSQKQFVNKENKYIKLIIYMSDTINLDVKSYSLPDLLQFANIFNKNIDDITEKEIEDGTNKHIRNTIQKQQPKYTRFFQQVQATLLSYLRASKKDNEEDDSDSSEEDKEGQQQSYVFSEKNDAGWSQPYNQVIISKQEKSKDIVRGNNNQIVDETHGTTIQQRLPISDTFNRNPMTQGLLNPNLKNTTKFTMNIDSHYRKIVGPPSISDISNNCSILTDVFKAPMPYPEDACNFTVNLSAKINKVINIKLQTVEIPVSWYVFSPNYGTTSFRIGVTSASGELFYPIDIPTTSLVTISEGNYDAASLIIAVQAALNAAFPGIYTISLDTATQKVTITGTAAFSMFFYVERTPAISANPSAGIPWDLPAVSGSMEDASEQCKTRGPKVDYNLGWLLGFRRIHYIGETSYTSEAPINTYGTRYIYVILDDFKKNHLNQDIISSNNDKETFNRVKTMNSCTPPPSFSHIAPQIEHGKNFGLCRLPQPVLDTERVATIQGWYSKQQLEIFWRAKTYTNRYHPWTGPDTIARIQVDLNKNAPVAGAQGRPKYILLSDKEKGIGSRNYFGPITLSRIKLKLMDDKGYILDLNNMDWSCQFEIESIYQY